MGFYGNITNVNKTSFTFDKTYPNRKAMDDAIVTDGIYVGRFVLVDYDMDSPTSNYTRVYVQWVGGANYFFMSPPGAIGDELEMAESLLFRYTDKPYIENGVINEKRFSEQYQGYLFNGEPVWCQNADGTLSFYEIKSSKDIVLGTKEDGTPYTVTIPVVGDPSPSYPSIVDTYYENYRIDSLEYGNESGTGIGRGYDSTVWQKVYVDNQEKYVSIAELNSVVPTFGITIDPPTVEPMIPHFGADTTNMYYRLHLQPNWGLKVRPVQKRYGIFVDDEYYGGAFKTAEEATQRAGELAAAGKISNDYTISQIDEQITYSDSMVEGAVGPYHNGNTWEKDHQYADYDGQIFYHKAGFDSTKHTDVQEGLSGADEISVTPTGKSGYQYYDYHGDDPEASPTEYPDIQEISIMLPSVGEAVSSLWDIMYGDGKENYTEGDIPQYEFKRNQYIAWDENRGNRMVELSEDGHGFDFSPAKVETVAGCLNSVHDLMGMILVQDTQKIGETIAQFENRKYEVSNNLVNRIYYGQYPTQYIMTARTDNGAVSEEYATWDEAWYQADEANPRVDNPTNIQVAPDLDTLRDKGFYRKDMTYFYVPSSEPSAKFVGHLKEWDNSTNYYLPVGNNYVKETQGYQLGNPYYEMASETLISLSDDPYESGKYFYQTSPTSMDYYLDYSQYPINNRAYYTITFDKIDVSETIDFKAKAFMPNFDTPDAYTDEFQHYFWQKEVEGDDGTGHGKGLFVIEDNIAKPYNKPSWVSSATSDDKETTVTQGTEVYLNEYRFEKRYDKDSDSIVEVYAFDVSFNELTPIQLIEFEAPSVTTDADGNIIRRGYISIPTDDGNGNFTDDFLTLKSLTEIILPESGSNETIFGYAPYSAVHPIRLPDTFYKPDTYFYKVGADYILGTETSAQENVDYYVIDPQLCDEFYMPNRYSQKIGTEYILDTADTPSDVDYYLYQPLYVSKGNDEFPTGSLWNPEVDIEALHAKNYAKDIELGIREEAWQMVKMEGFAKDLNTIHGILLKINQFFKFGDTLTRDTSTVQGCMNVLNDTVTKISELVPVKPVIIDQYGKIHWAEFESDKWIDPSIDPVNNHFIIKHIGPVHGEMEPTPDVAPLFGETFTIIDPHYDEKGHRFGDTSHIVTIPKGSLDDKNKTGSDVITQLAFDPPTGKLTTTRENISSLKLDGYTAGTSGGLTISITDTLGGALRKIQSYVNELDFSNEDNTQFISKITQIDGKVDVVRSTAGTLKLGQDGAVSNKDSSKSVVASDNLTGAFNKVQDQLNSQWTYITSLDMDEDKSTTQFISSIQQTDGKITVVRSDAGTLKLGSGYTIPNIEAAISTEDSLNSAFGKVQKYINNLKESVTSTKSELNNSINALETSLKALIKTTETTLQNSINELDNRVTALHEVKVEE